MIFNSRKGNSRRRMRCGSWESEGEPVLSEVAGTLWAQPAGRRRYEDPSHETMPIRSMTGFAQVKGQVADPQSNVPGKSPMGFTLSLKSVNHRFLDVHFRMPSDSDSLE